MRRRPSSSLFATGTVTVTISVALLLVAGSVMGCEDEAEERPPVPVIEPPPDPGEQARARRILDDEGNLIESDEVVAGLRLPRGLEEIAVGEGRYSYRTGVAFDKVTAYFGPRLLTGQVDRQGARAVFRSATPRDARGAVLKLDVAITPLSRTLTRIDIREIPAVPDNPPTEEELLRHWREEQHRLD